jgi:hypothetical protein
MAISYTQEDMDIQVRKLQWAEEVARSHSKKRHELARCIAILIEEAIDRRGHKIEEMYEQYRLHGSPGTNHAVLLDHLWLAFGEDYRPDPLIIENIDNILVEIRKPKTK